MTLEEIGSPPQVKELLYRPRELILVTGPTGSGKTTTLASMVNIINIERDCHIITVEDPIEYYHSHKKSLVTQREIGVHAPHFREVLEVVALRQDPDVILASPFTRATARQHDPSAHTFRQERRQKGRGVTALRAPVFCPLRATP